MSADEQPAVQRNGDHRITVRCPQCDTPRSDWSQHNLPRHIEHECEAMAWNRGGGD